MGNSQSQSDGNLKRYSRIGDQLRSVLRRQGRPAQENTADDEKPQKTGVAEQAVTNGGHDETPVRVCICGCVYVLNLYQQPQPTSMPVTVPCQVIPIYPF